MQRLHKVLSDLLDCAQSRGPFPGNPFDFAGGVYVELHMKMHVLKAASALMHRCLHFGVTGDLNCEHEFTGGHGWERKEEIRFKELYLFQTSTGHVRRVFVGKCALCCLSERSVCLGGSWVTGSADAGRWNSHQRDSFLLLLSFSLCDVILLQDPAI